MYFQILFLMASLSFPFCAYASEEQEEGKKTISSQTKARAQELAKKYAKPGQNAVVIIIPQKDLDLLFLEDPAKREKIEAKVLISDGQSTFKGKISPGGQSTLKAETPNLRVKKLENVFGTSNAIVGVENISGTTRINPLTMDEGYAATNFYQKSLNDLGLVPKASDDKNFKLTSKYVKVVYVPVDESGKLLENKKVSAGLHLVNNHPVKFLEKAQSDQFAVAAVGRSRYNVKNLSEKLGIEKVEPDAEIYSSVNSERKTAPHRVELSWSPDEASKQELKKLITDVYSAPVNLSGEALFQELSRKMDLDQMFRFMAFNHLIRNGDISDEYFWFTQKDKKTGQTVLRILPQDGDDLLKGVHMFPFNPQQMALIAKDKLHISNGFIINLEDPLFRAIKNDPYLYHQYLMTYKKVLKEVSSEPFLDRNLQSIEKELRNYSTDADVLLRGATDEVGKVYDQDSFSKRINEIRSGIRSNAEAALKGIDLEILEARKKMESQISMSANISCLKTNLTQLMKK